MKVYLHGGEREIYGGAGRRFLQPT